MTVAAGRRSTSARRASGSSSDAPLSATITGSRTTGTSPRRSSAARTAATVSADPSMPIFTASTPMSSATARTWPRIASGGIGVIPVTATVFCQVTAVIAVMPCTPQLANAFRSAWMPGAAARVRPGDRQDARCGQGRTRHRGSQHTHAHLAASARSDTAYIVSARPAPDEPQELELRQAGKHVGDVRPLGQALDRPDPGFDGLEQPAQARLQPRGQRRVRGRRRRLRRQARGARPDRTARRARRRPSAPPPRPRTAAGSDRRPAGSSPVRAPRRRRGRDPARSSAVISDPEPSVPSTTTVIRASAAMIRLRAGKLQRNGRIPGGISDTARPQVLSCSCRRRLPGG